MIIEQATYEDVEKIFSLLRRCKDYLIGQRIYQWDSEYPSIDNIESDISRSALRKCSINGSITGIVSYDEFQESQYSAVKWMLTKEPVVVIHRLAVDPLHQGKGLATKLMDFAERSATRQKYQSIRLDAYSGNSMVVRFYSRRGYKRVGQVFFPRRDLPFLCMEKRVII